MPADGPRYVPRTILSPEKCPIPDCTDLRVKSGLVCIKHAVEIWRDVQSVKGEPETQLAILESVAERERRFDAAEAKRAQGRKAPGWIYYIRLDDKIKIGWTSALLQRLRSYPPHAVKLTDHPGTRADERDLHRTFKPSRAAGREWYHPTQELLAHIERARLAEAERRDAEHQAHLAEAASEWEEVRAKAAALGRR